MEPNKGSEFWLQWAHNRSGRTQRHRKANPRFLLADIPVSFHVGTGTLERYYFT
jgi:hypothetical protein